MLYKMSTPKFYELMVPKIQPKILFQNLCITRVYYFIKTCIVVLDPSVICLLLLLLFKPLKCLLKVFVECTQFLNIFAPHHCFITVLRVFTQSWKEDYGF